MFRARRLSARVLFALAGAIVPPPSAGVAEPTVHRVLIERFAFVPERLEIRAGDRVEWLNRDLAPHTATAGDRAWDTEGLTKGQAASLAFPAPGTFAYICSYHPHMRGEIVVLGD